MSGAAPALRPGDKARATVFVAVTPADAFEVFTKEIDLWWKQGPKFRIAAGARSPTITPFGTARSARTSRARSECGGASS